MKTVKSVLMTAALALAFVVTAPLWAQTNPRHRATTQAPAPTTPPASLFTQHELEAFQSDDVLGWIRPGVKIKVNSITIGSDRKPVVDYNLTDSLDQPIDRLGKVTPGPVSVSF